MSRKKFFSIIIPAYNVENYLEECIESIEQQSFLEYEIILIDDGSTDRTGIMCDELAEKNSNIKVIHQSNHGQSHARNAGLEQATGKYVLFVDSDDFIVDESLKQIFLFINENNFPKVIVSRRYSCQENILHECKYVFDTPLMEKSNIAEKYSILMAFPDFWVAPWIFCVRMDYLRQQKLYFHEGIQHEDEEWVPEVMLNTDDIAFNNELFYCVRVNRAGSTTSVPKIKREFDKLQVIESLQEKFVLSKYNEEIVDVVKKRIQSIYFGILSEAIIYKKSPQFRKLVCELKSKRYIFNCNENDSIRFLYKVTRNSIKVLGIKNTMQILRWMRMIKGYINDGRKINNYYCSGV